MSPNPLLDHVSFGGVSEIFRGKSESISGGSFTRKLYRASFGATRVDWLLDLYYRCTVWLTHYEFWKTSLMAVASLLVISPGHKSSSGFRMFVNVFPIQSSTMVTPKARRIPSRIMA